MKRVLCTLVLALHLTVLGASAATVTKWLLGSQTTLLSTGFNSLVSDGFTALGTAFDNTIGQTGDGYTFCDIEGVFTFAGNPTANTGVTVWFLITQDGTNYENTPSATVILGRAPDVVLPVTAGQTGTRVVKRILCPWGVFKPIAQNTGTGQTMAASGNTIKIRPVTPEGV